MMGWCKVCNLLLEGRTAHTISIAHTDAEKHRITAEEFSALSQAMVLHILAAHPDYSEAINQTVALAMSVESDKLLQCEHPSFQALHRAALNGVSLRLSGELQLIPVPTVQV